jgi:hypothetical protein
MTAIHLRPSLRGDAAVDDEAGTGHEAGIVRGEKDDALGDIGNRPHAADRDAFQRLLTGRFKVVCAQIARAYRKDLIAHIGVDRAGMNRVDADPVALAGEFERRRLGEQRNPALGHRIERIVR